MEQEKKTNVFAIVGLVCAIMVGSILGLIFSIIGLKESKKCNSGKGLSIAGIIISIIRILFTILFIVLFLLIFRTTEFKDSYCANLSTNYEEVCKKNDDGTYDCIFATCTEEQLTKVEKIKEKFDKEGLIVNDKESTTNISLNGNKHTITTISEEGSAYEKAITIKFDKTTLVEKTPMSNIKYKVITSNNKDYLYVTYYKAWSNNGIIINEDGKVLKELSSYVKIPPMGGCTIVLDSNDSVDSGNIIYEKDNKIYYYKYVDGSKDDKGNIKIELIEITINNNEITEKTISERNGLFVQCTY